eukprot:m.469997 g.469997  ORF g.469997 m.469997 type:complete len:225 (-) comp57094_c0_seq11:105-779(-)
MVVLLIAQIGQTALMIAAKRCRVAHVKLLLAYGADLSFLDKTGQIAEDLAGFWSNEILEILQAHKRYRAEIGAHTKPALRPSAAAPNALTSGTAPVSPRPKALSPLASLEISEISQPEFEGVKTDDLGETQEIALDETSSVTAALADAPVSELRAEETSGERQRKQPPLLLLDLSDVQDQWGPLEPAAGADGAHRNVDTGKTLNVADKADDDFQSKRRRPPASN